MQEQEEEQEEEPEEEPEEAEQRKPEEFILSTVATPSSGGAIKSKPPKCYVNETHSTQR